MISLALATLLLPARPEPVKEIELKWATQNVNFDGSWLGYSADGKYLATRYRVTESSDEILVWNAKSFAAKANWRVGHIEREFGRPDSTRFGPRDARLIWCEKDRIGQSVLQDDRPPVVTEIQPSGWTGWPLRMYGILAVSEVNTLHLASVFEMYHIVDAEKTIVRFARVDPSRKNLGVQSSEQVLDVARVASVAVSPDQTLLAVAIGSHFDWPRPQSIEVRKLSDFKKIHTWKGNRDESLSLAFSPDGKHIAAGGIDGGLKLWDVTTGEELVSLIVARRSVSQLAYSPDGKYLATVNYDLGGQENLRILDVAAKKIVGEVAANPRGILRLAYSPDGKQIATLGGDGKLAVWDVAKLIEVK